MKSFRVWFCCGVLAFGSGTALADTGEDTGTEEDTGESSTDSTENASDRASDEGGSSCASGDEAFALFGLPLLALGMRRRRS